ncbi:unnamed protein product [Tilletia caries]|nr:unnamed protein product [Tilletia caries]
MPRTSAKQQVLRDVASELVRCVRIRSARRRRRAFDRGSMPDCSSSDSGSSVSTTSASDSSLSSSVSDSISVQLSSASDSDDSSADSTISQSSAKRDAVRAAGLLRSLASRRVVNPRRERRDVVPLYKRLQRLGKSSRPSDLQAFRHLVRMTPPAFDALVQVIASNPVFQATDPRRPQAPVEEQVAVTLFWLGRCGNGSGVVDVALACGCAEGSVTAYSSRVVQALYDIRQQVLCWASEDEKDQARTWVAQRSKCLEFGSGWSMVDGSQIPLAFKPGKHAHHQEYYDRKGQYALNLQLTVLPTSLRIIDFVAGYKGATQDSRAFAASDVVQNPLKYLDADDFIWADGGYGLSTFTCSPYDHIVATKSGDFRAFNRAVSNVRVRSEHAFGYLKGRFQSLRGLRVFIQDSEDHHRAVKTVVAALVAHNLALRWDRAEERQCFMDLTSVSEDARDAWLQLQAPDEARDAREAAAWSDRLQRHRQQKEAERERHASMSQYRIELQRRDAAKEKRERLHCALFAALNRPFIDTTKQSRLKNMTQREFQAWEDRQAQRRSQRSRNRRTARQRTRAANDVM